MFETKKKVPPVLTVAAPWELSYIIDERGVREKKKIEYRAQRPFEGWGV
jgi:hypothetical protein